MKFILPLKKIFSSSRRTYYSGYYYKILNKYENVSFFFNLINIQSARSNVKTERVIKFNNRLDFNLTQDQVKKIMGKPVLISYNSEVKMHVIYLYKLRLGDLKTKAEIHFYNGRMFLGVYLFDRYTWSELQKVDKVLKEKYSTDSASSLTESVVIDPLGNSVFIKEDAIYSINYLTGEPSVLDILKIKLEESISRPYSKRKRIHDHLGKHL